MGGEREEEGGRRGEEGILRDHHRCRGIRVDYGYIHVYICQVVKEEIKDKNVKCEF